MLKITTNSVEETLALGEKIGQRLKGGEVFAINGNLGAGKTHLIKGIVKGVSDDGDNSEVCSPTFVLAKEYLGGRLDVYHIDAYRIESCVEFENLGFDDMCSPASVVLVEWANKVQQAMTSAATVEIDIAHSGKNSREICIKGIEEL